LLFTSSKNEATVERLKALETIYSGAQLAELDLKLRGPGQIYGTSQHGRQVLKVASFSDFALIDKTKKEAEKIFPELEKYPQLLEKTREINLSHVSPD
jgi:ATP-dependent DNA helicase RecG